MMVKKACTCGEIDELELCAKSEPKLCYFVRCPRCGRMSAKHREPEEAVLKEHDAVEPKVSSTEQRCGNCNKVIEMDGWIACPWCGKPIAWNEWWNKNGEQEVK